MAPRLPLETTAGEEVQRAARASRAEESRLLVGALVAVRAGLDLAAVHTTVLGAVDVAVGEGESLALRLAVRPWAAACSLEIG